MPLLEIENLTYQLDMFSPLRSVSFKIERGENLVIFGLENSGVDILLSIITGLESGSSGTVTFKGQSLDDASYIERNSIRKEMVYLQKRYGLISNMTVEENIALPLHYHSAMTPDEILSHVDEIIEELNLFYCRDLRPVNLKASEMLKAAYGRAISQDPDLLMVEHPLEGQNMLNIHSFMDSLKKRCDREDKSVIIVGYKPKYFLDYSDRFIMLDQGRVVFDGTAHELLYDNNEFVRQYFSNSVDGPMGIL